MSKKILALALAILFIATAFTACKKGPELTEINGKEYPLETNRDGETIINEDNQIAVLVTDRNNEVLTYENGENQTHWVQISGPLLIEDRIQTKNFSLGIIPGWEGDAISGRVVKEGTDGQCYIQCAELKKLKGEETLDSYLEGVDAQDTAIAEAFEDEEQMAALIKENPAAQSFVGSKYTLSKSEGTVVSSLNCQIRVHKITDKNGDLIHYVENYYFVSDKTIYKLDYVCNGGKGYDESFQFRNYISQAFTFDIK